MSNREGSFTLGNGSTVDGGIEVKVEAGTFDFPVKLRIVTRPDAPTGVGVPGGILLPRTLEVSVDPPVALKKALGIVMNLHPGDVAGHDPTKLVGGLMTQGSVEPVGGRVGLTNLVSFRVTKVGALVVYEIVNPGPSLMPAQFTSGFGGTLAWRNPPSATQYQLQLTHLL